MSESLVVDAYQARQQKQLDDFMASAPAAGGAGAGGDGAPAPVQPTAPQSPQSPQKPQAGSGIVDEVVSPWASSGKQIADAIVPPPSSQAGVPRRLWEFTKGMGHALVAPAESVGNLVGHVLSAGDDAAQTLTDATLDKKIADAKAIAALPGAGSSSDVNALPMYERLRAMPYDERLKLMHDSASFAVSNVAAASGLALPISGLGAVTQGLTKASRWIRSGAAAVEEAAPAAAAGERMAGKLGTSTLTDGVKMATEPGDLVKQAERELGAGATPDQIEQRINELQQVPVDTGKVVEAADAANAIDHEPGAVAGGSPNVDRMNVSDMAKSMVQNINGQLEEAGALTRGTLRTNDATIEAAASSPYRNIETILAHPDEQPLAAHDLTAARDVRDAVLTHAETLTERFLAGDQSVGAEMRAAILTTGQVSAKVTNAGTALGRGLQAGNIASDAARARGLDLSRWSKSIEAMSADLPATDEELAQAFGAARDREVAAQVADWTAKRPSAFWDIYYGLNMLSSPATHISKTSGEVAAQLVSMSDRTLGAIVARPFRWLGVMKGPGLSLNETPAYVSGAIEHLGDAFRAARNAYTPGGRVFEGGIVNEMTPGANMRGMQNLYGEVPAAPSASVDPEQDGGLLAKFYDVAATKARGGLVGSLQSAGQFVKNTMGGVADFWRMLTFHGEISALAERKGAELGLSADEVAALKASPSADMIQQAEAAGKERTFSKEFTNQYAQKLADVAASPLARLTVTPFWRTPVRLAEFGMDHTPVLNEIASAVRGDFQAGGVRAEMALGRSASSWGFTAGMYQLAAHGVITGAGPSDPMLRKHMEATGWQPFSVDVGGKYISYKPLLATLPAIGAAATLAEMAPSLKDGELYTALQATVLAQVRGALDHPFWSGAADVVEAFSQAQKGSTDGITKLINNRLTSIMPGAAAGRTIVRGTTDKLDTAVTGDASGVWGEVQSLVKQFQSNIPGWANGLPAERNIITGEPIVRGVNVLGMSPYVVTTKSEDTVLQELARLKGAGIPAEVPRVLGGTRPDSGPVDAVQGAKEGVRLTEAERSFLTDRLTKATIFGGRNLHDELERVVGSKSYQRLSEGANGNPGADGAKALELRRIFAGALRNAEAETKKKFPELGDAVLARQMARKQALMPVPGQAAATSGAAGALGQLMNQQQNQ